MDIEELEKRLRTINEEESCKIKKVVESYQHSQKVIKQLMDEHLKGEANILQPLAVEEEEEIDKRKFSKNIFKILSYVNLFKIYIFLLKH